MRAILLALARTALLGSLLPERLRPTVPRRAVGRTLLGSRFYFSNSSLSRTKLWTRLFSLPDSRIRPVRVRPVHLWSIHLWPINRSRHALHPFTGLIAGPTTARRSAWPGIWPAAFGKISTRRTRFFPVWFLGAKFRARRSAPLPTRSLKTSSSGSIASWTRTVRTRVLWTIPPRAKAVRSLRVLPTSRTR